MNNIEHNGGNRHDFDGGREGTGPDGPAPTAGDPGHFMMPDLAKSVTRQVRVSGPESWRLLLAGLDTLDLGFYVLWDDRWQGVTRLLEDLKAAAFGTKGVELPPFIGHGMIYPSGGQANYAFHLLMNGIHLFASRSLKCAKSPVLLVRLPSERLWHENIGPQLREVKSWIARHGGKIDRIIVSRADLAADFEMEEPLSADFIKTHLISRMEKTRFYHERDILQSFYLGQGESPIQMRIYDKSAEIKAGGSLKEWFYRLWNMPLDAKVIRVEFQLRRKALRQFGLHSLDALPALAPKIWNALTGKWCSLRIPDDPNQTRRTVHPWWAAVQSVGEDLGSTIAAERNTEKGGTAPVEWYIAHSAGCSASFAARLGISSVEDACRQMCAKQIAYWLKRDFLSVYRQKRMLLNLPVDELSEEEVADA